MRDELAAGLQERSRQLGAPQFSTPLEEIATVFLTLVNGLAIESLLDSGTVPAHLLGRTFSLIYQGLLAQAQQGKPLAIK